MLRGQPFASLRAFFSSVISPLRAFTILAISCSALRARVPAALLPAVNFSSSTFHASTAFSSYCDDDIKNSIKKLGMCYLYT